MKARSKELLDRAIAATIAAIEIYNKPDFRYREEAFAVLAINGWELLLKAKWLNMTIGSRLHRIVAAQPYPLLFATISGAHLYGFPSPDSDFDLRGAHVLPLERVIGLGVRDETVEDSGRHLDHFLSGARQFLYSSRTSSREQRSR